jgi:hypothetical protein
LDDAAAGDFDADFAAEGNNKTNSASTHYTVASARHTKALAHNANRTFCRQLPSIARQALSESKCKISIFNKDENEYCAATGATDTMWPEYFAFISYHKTPGAQVKLGDGTMLDSPGKGSIKVSLNGKIVILRNVLHVPALQDPLYSLRRHTKMPGCGYFAFYGTDTHLLFPDFALAADTSVDNLVSYRSLGRSYDGPVHYAEPRHYCARPVTLIPPDEAADLSKIH